jgi:hypothetical protein
VSLVADTRRHRSLWLTVPLYVLILATIALDLWAVRRIGGRGQGPRPLTTGRIVLETDAPAGVVAAVTTLTGAASASQQAASQVLVRRTTTTDAFNRRDDSPPFRGGAGITDGSVICSSAFAVRNSAGTVFMATAGHCFPNGTAVETEVPREGVWRRVLPAAGCDHP